MAKSPAYRWYPKDVLTSLRVMEMTLEEEGAYRRALDICWLNGSLPADPERLAKAIGKGASLLVAQVVLAMFVIDEHDPSRIVHDRLEEERQKQREWSEKSAKGGKASAGKPKKPKLKSSQQGGSSKAAPNIQPNGDIPFASSLPSLNHNEDKKTETANAIHVGTVLDGITKSLGLKKLSSSQEREWTLGADWGFDNGFTAAEFVDCFAELTRTRNYPIQPKYVIDNLPAFIKNRRKIVKLPTPEEALADARENNQHIRRPPDEKAA